MRDDASPIRTAARTVIRARRTGPVTLAAALLTAALIAVGGCGSLAQAQQEIGRSDLVNDLANRLNMAGELTFTADYQLPGGKSGSMSQAQQPLRTAYTYPGGDLTVTVDATTECRSARARTTCTLTAPPAPSTNPTASLFAEPGGHGLVPPAIVVSLLTAAALDADAVITQRDTTVAGEHATCVDVRAVENAPASAFSTCITTAGVLGSFSGVLNGSKVEMTMTRFQRSVDSDAFLVPSGATVVDRRAGAK